MLSQEVAIVSPSSLGGGQYSFNLHFSNSSKAKFLRVGDYIEDSDNNKYEIDTWATYPNDFVSSNQVTVTFIDTDTLPQADTDYDSLAYTLGQEDTNPQMQTGGQIGNISIYSGKDYEYELEAFWNSSTEANKAQVTDKITDSNGKEFEISYLSASRFSDPFRIKEVEKVGISPAIGDATLYRSTPNKNFYQGSKLTDSARTAIFNRDKYLIDTLIYALEQNGGSGGEGKALETDLTNNSGSILNVLTPVRSTSGKIDTIDPSIEAEVVAIVGITKQSISSGSSGTVTIAGLIENVATSIPVDTVVYLSKTGTITNTIPDIGVGGFVSGDFVVQIGQIIENSSNPSNKDLKVKIEIMGQL